ncbi:MAG TPA: DUF4433 domain-containing protein [Terriglobales bacterium]|nr:DUF4433 domain-containing protein [Terriglobales bacterium]
MQKLVLNPDKGLIFRIVRKENVGWILQNGIHAQNSGLRDPNFLPIGNPGLISKRSYRSVPIGPGGVLSDYVPFYFTPYSIMLYNIVTGHGVSRVERPDIVIAVSSLARVRAAGGQFIFTDGHAYAAATTYYDDPADLVRLDWALLNRRDFRNDPEDPGKKERYQAEALVWKMVPAGSLLAICCHNESIATALRQAAQQSPSRIEIRAQPDWFL